MPKPYTAVSVAIETQTSEAFAVEDLSCIPDLVELVTIQATGPEEAARAIRKKLKYGNVHRQLRALVLLDGLIQNAGTRFQQSFCNEALLERLRVCGTSSMSDGQVRKKCEELFRSWSQYRKAPGMVGIANLANQLPRRKVTVTRDVSKAVKETENPFDDDEDMEAGSSDNNNHGTADFPMGSSSSGIPYGHPTGAMQSFSHGRPASSTSFWSRKSKDKDSGKKKKKRTPFDLEQERPKIKATIAESSLAATNLQNSLQSVNREKERISENAACLQRFNECKVLRRKILRYIHNVSSEDFLGGLLHANDELIQALITFEQLDRSIDADSDSDDDLAQQAHIYRMAQLRLQETGGSSSSQPSSPKASQSGFSPSSSPSSPQHTGSTSFSKVSSPPRVPPPRPSAASKPPPAMPPRPSAAGGGKGKEGEVESEDEDPNDPFADSNIMV